jgi:hypothetical protein
METINLILPQAERILSLSISHEMSLMFISPNDHLVVTARDGVIQAISSAPTRHKGGVGARAALNAQPRPFSLAITSSPVLASFIK